MWQNEAKMRNPFNARRAMADDMRVAGRYDRTLRLSAVGAGVTGEVTPPAVPIDPNQLAALLAFLHAQQPS